MTLYQKFKRLKIDFSAIGLERSDTKVTYFCTPKGARIIGWAGVDGIHYCFVRGHEEMVFAVSPSNLPGDYVHPIARSFEDLLRLLLACGSMDAIEQAHLWDEEQFDKYVAENQTAPKALSVFDVLQDTLGITPMERPFAYVKELQASFDYSQIKYPPEYYDIDMNPAAEPEDAPEWRVTYDGGFWPRRGRAGKEVPVGKRFQWGDEAWYVPAVYACGAGLVMDFCMEVEPALVREFIDKWDLLNEDKHRFTEEQREQMQDEHPLNVRFRVVAELNGKPLREEHGTCMTWFPESCLEDGAQTQQEAKWLLEHYGLDLSRAWAIHRLSFRWATKRAPAIKTLCLRLEREPVSIPGFHFENPKVGDEIPGKAPSHVFQPSFCAGGGCGVAFRLPEEDDGGRRRTTHLRNAMNRTIKTVLGAAFALYGVIMLWLLFGQRLGADIPGAYWDRLRDNVNLIPFFTIREFMETASLTANPYLMRHAFINLAGNVAMFVPLGFFPPCLWGKLRGFGRCMLCAAACIVTIEIIQLFTLLGSCDVDDLILNMAGVAIGYGLYRIFSLLLRRFGSRTNP